MVINHRTRLISCTFVPFYVILVHMDTFVPFYTEMPSLLPYEVFFLVACVNYKSLSFWIHTLSPPLDFELSARAVHRRPRTVTCLRQHTTLCSILATADVHLCSQARRMRGRTTALLSVLRA